MEYFTLLIYGVALAASGYAQTPGRAIVTNYCSSTVFFASVDYWQPPSQPISPGQSYNEVFRLSFVDGEPAGISIKLSYDPSLPNDDITQFEYTYNSNISFVYYDVSNINGNPFFDDGFILVGTSPACQNITCLPGESYCNVYEYPTESGVVYGCDSNNNLVLTLCSTTPSSLPRRSDVVSQRIDYIDEFSNDAMDYRQCSSRSPCEGDITYFTTGHGACGSTIDGSIDKVAALPYDLIGDESTNNSYCGKNITITSIATGKTIIAQVIDQCMSCGRYSIDISKAAFLELDDLSNVRTRATWYFT